MTTGGAARVAAGLFSAFLLFSLSAAQAQVRPSHGRLFPPEDLGVLEGPDRDAWQEPELIMDALGIFDGAVVADVGAGGGWFTVRLAQRVGPNGLVYAEDIQPQMIESINRRVRRAGLTNVQAIIGTPSNPMLPGPIDALLMVEVYSQIEDPVTLLRNVMPRLKPGGRVGIVEYRLDGGGPAARRAGRARNGHPRRAGRRLPTPGARGRIPLPVPAGLRSQRRGAAGRIGARRPPCTLP